MNGPSTSTLPIFGMRSSPVPGRNENSTSSDSASVRATNVTPILCGPAVTFSGMFWNRLLTAVTAAACCWSMSFRSSGPPIVFSKTFTPSSSTTTVCWYSMPRR